MYAVKYMIQTKLRQTTYLVNQIKKSHYALDLLCVCSLDFYIEPEQVGGQSACHKVVVGEAVFLD